jgi:hypothetical protein
VDGPQDARIIFAFRRVGSIAVMCPAFRRGTRPLALMGSVDRALIMLSGSRCPMARSRFLPIRRSTDIAITRCYPRISDVPVRATWTDCGARDELGRYWAAATATAGIR